MSEPPALDYRISKLTLAPNDILVVRVRGHLTPDKLEVVRDHFSRALGSGQRILIIDEVIDLSVLSRDALVGASQ